MFTPGYDMDREVPQPTLSGLGENGIDSNPLRMWDENGGVFKPGGYGGGVFDGNISGLGSIGARRTVKGVGMRGLGQDDPDLAWGVKSDRAIELQSTINAYLIGMGMCPIGVDGKLGPSTCGAAAYVVQQKGGNVAAELPSACNDRKTSWTAPRKNTGQCGASTTTTSPITTTPGAPILQSGMSSSSKRVLGFALGGVLAIGAVMVLKKKR